MRRLVLSMILLVGACSDDPAGVPDASITARDAQALDAAPLLDAADMTPDAADMTPDAADMTPDAADMTPDAADMTPDAADMTPDATSPDASTMGPMELTSPNLPAGMPIPRVHTCRGVDTQPAFDFVNVPAGTQSLALVLIDDSIDFVHWIALDIPAGTTGLADSASDQRMLPMGTREIPAYGTQYRGPCPGSVHTYSFRLYALPVAMTTFTWPRNIAGRHLAMAFANPLATATLTRTFTP